MIAGDVPPGRVDRAHLDRFARVQRQGKINLDTRLAGRKVDPLERMTSDEAHRSRNRVEHKLVVHERSTAPRVVGARAP